MTRQVAAAYAVASAALAVAVIVAVAGVVGFFSTDEGTVSDAGSATPNAAARASTTVVDASGAYGAALADVEAQRRIALDEAAAQVAVQRSRLQADAASEVEAQRAAAAAVLAAELAAAKAQAEAAAKASQSAPGQGVLTPSATAVSPTVQPTAISTVAPVATAIAAPGPVAAAAPATSAPATTLSSAKLAEVQGEIASKTAECNKKSGAEKTSCMHEVDLLRSKYGL